MKNSTNIILGILALAVGYLYFLHFKTNDPGNSAMPSLPVTGGAGSSNLVYVNIDSLLDHYELYQKMKSDFEVKQKSTEEEIEKRKSALQDEYASTQDKAKSGLMTEKEMQQAEEKLMKKQQDLMDYKDSEEGKLASENQKLNKDLYGKITSFLGKMNKSTNYQFVFGYTKEGGILLANDSLNITKYVLDGLNKEGANQER